MTVAVCAKRGEGLAGFTGTETRETNANRVTRPAGRRNVIFAVDWSPKSSISWGHHIYHGPLAGRRCSTDAARCSGDGDHHHGRTAGGGRSRGAARRRGGAERRLYSISVDGKLWLEGEDTFITSGGTVYSLGAGTLELEKTAKTTGMDGLGAFQQTTLVLRAGTTPPQTVEFSIKAWDDGETLEFVQSFPMGLSDSVAASQFSPEPFQSSCNTTRQPCSHTKGGSYCNSSSVPGQCNMSYPSVHPDSWCVGNAPEWFSNNISFAGCRAKATAMAAKGTADGFDYSPWPGNATGQPGGTCGGVANCAQCRIGHATPPVNSNLAYTCYILEKPLPCPACPGPVPKPPGDPNAVSTSFPAWRPAAISGTPQRAWMAYDGWDCDGKHGTCLVQNKANADPSSAHVAFGRWEIDGGSQGGVCSAKLLKKLSDKGQCVEGKTFGCANGTLWLTDCRGVFQCNPGTQVTCSSNVPMINGTRHCPCGGKETLPGGLEGSGPMAIFTSDLNRTLVVSAFSNTMAQSQHFVNGTLHYGLLGSVTDVPKGWSSSVILSLGKGPTHPCAAGARS